MTWHLGVLATDAIVHISAGILGVSANCMLGVLANCMLGFSKLHVGCVSQWHVIDKLLLEESLHIVPG